MTIILHITSLKQWSIAKRIGLYRGDTLDSQGFIHCSTLRQVTNLANALYRNQKGLVLLCIEAEKVKAEKRYESFEGKETYPHIYGPLNADAVVKVVRFTPGKNGEFELPEILANIAE